MSADWSEYIQRLRNEAIRLCRFQPPKPDDAAILHKRIVEMLKRVHGQVDPIAKAAVDDGSIHTEHGRKAFLETVQKFYRDALREYSHDELVFITAFVLAQATLDQYA